MLIKIIISSYGMFRFKRFTSRCTINISPFQLEINDRSCVCWTFKKSEGSQYHFWVEKDCKDILSAASFNNSLIPSSPVETQTFGMDCSGLVCSWKSCLFDTQEAWAECNFLKSKIILIHPLLIRTKIIKEFLQFYHFNRYPVTISIQTVMTDFQET